jgi:hypothetical protein
MDAGIRYDIDDSAANRPHVRLCHRILSEALAGGFAAIELATPPAAMPTARVQVGGEWQWFMAFPPPACRTLVEYLRHMAGVAHKPRDADGTILVRCAGRDAAIALHARRDEQGRDALMLRFPPAGPGNA